MANRVGTYLSDENVRNRCVAQTPPMSQTYGLFITPGTELGRMPQRPQNPVNLMLALARAKGIPYAQLKSQYVDALSLVARQESVVVGGLNRGMPTPPPSMTPVALARTIAAGGISGSALVPPSTPTGGSSASGAGSSAMHAAAATSRLPPAPTGGSSSTTSSQPGWHSWLFGQQPTKSQPIRSRPIIVPVTPTAAQTAAKMASVRARLAEIQAIPGDAAMYMPRVGDSNSERRSSSSSYSSTSSDEDIKRLEEKDDAQRDESGEYKRGEMGYDAEAEGSVMGGSSSRGKDPMPRPTLS